MPAESRTEKATPKRRKEARKKGQIAHSPDLSGALILIAALAVISADGSSVADGLGKFMRGCIRAIADPALYTSRRGLGAIGSAAVGTIANCVLPVAGTCVAVSLIAGAGQAGLRPHLGALRVDAKRLNPVSGIKNMLSPNALFEALKAIVKVLAVGSVAAAAIVPAVSAFAHQLNLPPTAIGSVAAGKALEVAQRAAAAYLLIGVADYAWRRLRNERQMRMTKQEVKDEARLYSLPGEVRQAIRRRQAQLARARMMAAVPEADVVLVNPTHYAVALRYDGSKPAPEVIAKGQELIAAQIRKIATEHDVPVVSDPPLARALYADTEIGQVIPVELYAAVARVLAFVYRLAHRASGKQRAPLAQNRGALAQGVVA